MFWSQESFIFLKIIEDTKKCSFMWVVSIGITTLDMKTEKFKKHVKHIYSFILNEVHYMLINIIYLRKIFSKIKKKIVRRVALFSMIANLFDV